MKYTAQKKSSRQNKMRAIEKKIQTLEQQLRTEGEKTQIFSKQNTLTQIEKLLKDREELLQYKFQGIMIRNRREWLLYGEKNIKLFCSLEKKNYTRKNRYVIETEDGQVLTENVQMSKEQFKYYVQLFTSREINVQKLGKYLEEIDLPKLSQEECDDLNAEITKQEIKNALWDMKSDKVPGTQGIPPEFYRYFWPNLHQLIFHLIQDATQNGFSINARRGIISLMEKMGKI